MVTSHDKNRDEQARMLLEKDKQSQENRERNTKKIKNPKDKQKKTGPPHPVSLLTSRT